MDTQPQKKPRAHNHIDTLCILRIKVYFGFGSPAPHADPHADPGVFSGFGSAAPHADPGVSSGFGSPAPHADPHADPGVFSGFGSAAPHADPHADPTLVPANAATFSRLLIIVTSFICLLDFLTSLVYT